MNAVRGIGGFENFAECKKGLNNPIRRIKMEKEKLQKILENHKLWLRGDGGERADLSYADLEGNTDLENADLRCADLRLIDLYGADLRYANLKGAVLSQPFLPAWSNGRATVL